jgi:hypothetical protein
MNKGKDKVRKDSEGKRNERQATKRNVSHPATWGKDDSNY